MKHFGLSLLRIIGFAGIGASTGALTLQVGQQELIKIKGSPSITVSNPQAIKIVPNTNQIQVIARQPGFGEISISKPRQKIDVTIYSSKVGEVRQAVLKWLHSTYGMSLETKPDKVILHGTALRTRDWMDVQNFKGRFGALFNFDVIPSERISRQIEMEMNDELRRRSISSGRGSFRNGRLELISTANEKEKLTTNEIAKQFGAKEVQNGSNVELKPMIEIEVLIAEMKKNSMRSLGLKPPEVYSASLMPTGDLKSTAVTFNPITAELHAYFSQNKGRVLANPKLVCRSGEIAHFVAGGEIPIKIMSWRNSDVIWKRYGVILDITPTADFNDGISTKIATEISLLDEAHKVDGIPGFLTNRIDTHFDLRGSHTIALSGLIKSEIGRNTNGIALLGEIPILGELFKSRDYQENKTELVIFVTPKVISPENPPEAVTTHEFLNSWQDDE